MDVSLDRIKRWGIKGGLSVLDQGIYSGSNFILVILLARWQQPQEYGAFSVAFATFLFLSGIYGGLILEPVSILGPSRFSENKASYLSDQLWLHFLITIPLAIIFGLCILFLQNPLLRAAFVAASFALPFMLLTWLARRIYYSNHQPFGAVLSSILYSIVLLMGLAVIWKSETITITLIFTIMAVAGFVSGISYFWVEFRKRKNYVLPIIPIQDVIRAHWDLGKWIVVAAVFSLAADQSPIFFIATLLSLDDVGRFKAVQNFVLPIIQVEAALSLIGLPILAREFGTKNLVNFRYFGKLILAAMTSASVTYWIAIWYWGNSLAKLVYGNQYSVHSSLIALYCIVPVLIGLYSVFFMSLRAIQKTQIYLINGVVSLLIGVPSSYLLTSSYGLFGAILGLIITHTIIFITNVYLYFYWVRKASFT
jgi:O-antigen/teichoic acid export membrane protein